MAKRGIMALGLLMILVGGAAILFGLDPASLSFGQTLIVAGSVGASCGGVIVALAVLIGRLESLFLSLTPRTVTGAATRTEVETSVVNPPADKAGLAPALAVVGAAGAAAAIAAPRSETRLAPAEMAPAEPPLQVEPPHSQTTDINDAHFDLDKALAKMLSEANAPLEVPPFDLLPPSMPEAPPAGEAHKQDMLQAGLMNAELVDSSIAALSRRMQAEPTLAEIPVDDVQRQADAAPLKTLLREGVIAHIPFKLYGDGSITATIGGEERGFASLKEFRDYVGG